MASLFEIPLFDAQKVPKALLGKTGVSFQHFIADLFRCEGLPIIEFDTQGNDGRIDHLVALGSGYQVIICPIKNSTNSHSRINTAKAGSKGVAGGKLAYFLYVTSHVILWHTRGSPPLLIKRPF